MDFPLCWSITWKSVLAVSALVCCLMLGALVGVPWLFADPYDDTYENRITHESTDAFNESVGGHYSGDPKPVDELSPAARAVVERGITEYQNGDGEGWTRYRVEFCRDVMPVCDKEEPARFDYFTSTGERHFVEAEDGVYLLRTSDPTVGATPGPFGNSALGQFFSTISFISVMAGLAFMAITGYLGRTPGTGNEWNPNVVLGLAAYGALLTGLLVIDPLLRVMYDFTVFPVSWVILTWGVLFIAVLHPISDG